jgi:hypothetical protein
MSRNPQKFLMVISESETHVLDPTSTVATPVLFKRGELSLELEAPYPSGEGRLALMRGGAKT